MIEYAKRSVITSSINEEQLTTLDIISFNDVLIKVLSRLEAPIQQFLIAYEQGSREITEAQGQKRILRPRASEASRTIEDLGTTLENMLLVLLVEATKP